MVTSEPSASPPTTQRAEPEPSATGTTPSSLPEPECTATTTQWPCTPSTPAHAAHVASPAEGTSTQQQPAVADQPSPVPAEPAGLDERDRQLADAAYQA